jgi:hypothetical protein
MFCVFNLQSINFIKYHDKLGLNNVLIVKLYNLSITNEFKEEFVPDEKINKLIVSQ